MKVLGIDPGLATIGFGMIEKQKQDLVVLDFGVIKTCKSCSLGERLVEISEDIENILENFKPDFVAVERLFFFRNVTNAISVGHARGVILEKVYKRKIPCYEFTPLEIKRAITGYGKANKQQMQHAVKLWLHLKKIPQPDDAADALATALTFIHSFAHLQRQNTLIFNKS